MDLVSGERGKHIHEDCWKLELSQLLHHASGMFDLQPSNGNWHVYTQLVLYTAVGSQGTADASKTLLSYAGGLHVAYQTQRQSHMVANEHMSPESRYRLGCLQSFGERGIQGGW